MRRMMLAIVTLVACAVAAGSAAALDRAAYDELVKQMDDSRRLEADVFAPNAWAKAEEALAKAEKALATERKQGQLDKQVAEAREFVENAGRASEVCRLSLQQHLPPRARAQAARAAELVAAAWAPAQARFLKAAAKIESGDVKGGLAEAAAAAPLFDRAELEAIRVSILGEADRLIAQAETDEAVRYALATLDRARTARREADAILLADRTRHAAAARTAAEAEYEARHASTIAQSVRSLARNDQAWEKLMLLYEIQMDHAGAAIGLPHLPFDDGPQAAADTLVARIQGLRAEVGRLATERGAVAIALRSTAARVGATGGGDDGASLVRAIDERFDALFAEKRELATRIESGQADLAELSEEHAAVASQLSARKETEEKFRQARALITPADGEVLYDAAGDVILRLSGLAFESGKSDLRDVHLPLLAKVQTILGLYPGARVVVEGHTDGAGDPVANQRLSERRALAVMQSLRAGLEIPAERIQAIGFGAERPVASNQTTEGKAKNRRIDVVIMR